ncbi:VWA domain-containing protein [Comamonas testosteroni]|uniref:VWA domain-containing protein n=1 Tax=Comamonas testosteroni TaxID=285 RepID=UPI0012FEB476|nr:VWA domain-containing protein [Comamonas testosteroni]
MNAVTSSSSSLAVGTILTAAALAKLSEFDYVVVIDKSGSMAEPVKPGDSRSRYEAVQESALGFARDVGKLDSDGIDVVMFSGSGIVSHTGVTADTVKDVFAQYQPRGGTPLAEALTEALKLAGKSDKKDFIVVFTDGEPDDKAAAAKVIIDAANRQETDDALTILFVQVGDDAGATKYLRSLDDELTGAKFDIVDAKTVAEADAFPTTAHLILAAIED